MNFRTSGRLVQVVTVSALCAATHAIAYTPFAIDELRVQWSNANTQVSFVDQFDNEHWTAAVKWKCR